MSRCNLNSSMSISKQKTDRVHVRRELFQILQALHACLKSTNTEQEIPEFIIFWLWPLGSNEQPNHWPVDVACQTSMKHLVPRVPIIGGPVPRSVKSLSDPIPLWTAAITDSQCVVNHYCQHIARNNHIKCLIWRVMYHTLCSPKVGLLLLPEFGTKSTRICASPGKRIRSDINT